MGLMDQPGGRKHHESATPLIGGLALYVVVFIASLTWGRLGSELYYYLAASGIIVMTGALDDRFHLGVRIRLLLEIIAACLMMFGAGVVINDLGNLFGLGNIVFPVAIAVLYLKKFELKQHLRFRNIVLSFRSMYQEIRTEFQMFVLRVRNAVPKKSELPNILLPVGSGGFWLIANR